ncbi:probable carotenoid cleavage dioxygenase 4, chloroplastic [Salvia hispanica]|uniref:probable carotenoid cleavage dioxygenase 4, chloroplastic n=1 Tax=Salvia hispanica TaxID=49212 RepID=UPI002009B63C|nr:probable carotenoid cleavage dioxygenase 4, chloroplastic [Salvia hispanica]
METLNSSFLPKQTIPSFKIHQKLNQKLKIITANSCFTTSHPKKNPETLKSPPTKKRRNQSFLATIFNNLDHLICTFLDPPLRPAIDPNHVLSGSLAPVSELPPTPCTVTEGSLPPCLDGAYIRNGPNPHFTPKSRPYHFLDGDGMLHVIKISQGKPPTFCCRYVSTHKHAAERDAGYPFVPSVFSSFTCTAASTARAALLAARVISGQLDPANCGFGAANTSLALISGRLFALCESDLPYAVELTAEGDLKTLGRHGFGSAADDPFSTMTAHPKIDPITGEAFAFAYNIAPPFLTFFRIDSGGRKRTNVPIFSMESFSCAHDFAVTANYAVFFDIQITANPWWILRGRPPMGADTAKVARLGIIPRYAEDEKDMRWIEAPELNVLHCVNAWEEDDDAAAITMVVSNATSVENVLERIDLAELKMEKITVNLETATLERRQLSKKPLDFAVINPAYAAKENRYVYAVILGKQTGIGVVKLDLSMEGGEECTVASRLYGPGCYGGEPFFVARDPENSAAEEDDGYLVTYVHDENAQESKFLVMDAKSSTLDIVAAVKLPQRVPGGFHGLFLSELELHKIRMASS